jgi:1-acyl-sn-glycerol-3-phosphate acyltransferase
MTVKKPNAIVYFIVYIFFLPLLKILFHLKIDRAGYEPPKEPFIVVSNHSSFMDFLIVMLSLYPRRFNAVTAQKFFHFKPLNTFLPLMGCIPKNLFDPDVRSIIGIKQVLKRGGRILLFPEGRCACDGVYTGIHKSTGKLIKKLNVPVVSASIDGAYNCMPFWRDGIRAGRVRIILANLFSQEQLGSLSIDEVNDALDKRLSRSEDLPPKKPFRLFSSRRLAEGLENILYWCPKCNREFTTETKNCVISCSACGNAASLDRDMSFTPTADSIIPADIHEWYKAQARYEARQLSEDMEPVSVRVNVRLPSELPGRGMDTCGSGIIKLDPSGWHYKGVLNGEDVCLFFPIDTVPALPIDPNDVFQIYAHGTFYMFSPENTRECVKYSVIGECAYWRFASRNQMTPSGLATMEDSGFC